jgi:hypothetical protein
LELPGCQCKSLGAKRGGRDIMIRSGGGSYFPRVRVTRALLRFLLLIGNFLGTRIVTNGVCPSPYLRQQGRFFASIGVKRSWPSVGDKSPGL